jgi:hypothetical protein
MVISKNISTCIHIAVTGLLFSAAGCTKTATLTLKLTPKDLTTYKVTTETEDSIRFEGSLLDDPALKSKSYQRNFSRNEMTFNQQVQNIDDKGDAIAKITVKELKCHSIYQNNPVLDFDSSTEKDQNNPLIKLIGLSYTIKISPTGEVVKVIDTNEARTTLEGVTTATQRPLILLSDEAIKIRHTIQAIPDRKTKILRKDNKWSKINTFSFRQMGAKSYEKIYSLKKIKNINNKQLAIIQMNAIPSSATAEELHKKQAISPITNIFDNIETYTGELQFDLTAGIVEKYNEKLRTEWVMVDSNPKNVEEPGIIRMTAIRSYSLEKVEQ